MCPSQNDVSEKEQRWGAKTVNGSGHQEHINIHQLRENVFQEHQNLKERELQTGPKASHGYGGKFGVEQDRMDKVSVDGASLGRGDQCSDEPGQQHSVCELSLFQLCSGVCYGHTWF